MRTTPNPTIKDALSTRLKYNYPVLGLLPEVRYDRAYLRGCNLCDAGQAFATLATPPGLHIFDPRPALLHATSVADEACVIAGDSTVGVRPVDSCEQSIQFLTVYFTDFMVCPSRSSCGNLYCSRQVCPVFSHHSLTNFVRDRAAPDEFARHSRRVSRKPARVVCTSEGSPGRHRPVRELHNLKLEGDSKKPGRPHMTSVLDILIMLLVNIPGLL